MKYFFAPVQGHTDAAYRRLHAEVYGGDTTYFTPFLRFEKGDFRKKDCKEAAIALSDGVDTIAQVIFRDYAELSALVNTLVESGHHRVDINMGCPFPLQTARGRGAATLARQECIDAVARVVSSTLECDPTVKFSVKMRLGMDDDNEWKAPLEMLNSLPIEHVTIHPRTARDQYSAPLRMERFADFLEAARIPVIYNGDILQPQDAARICDRFPQIAGLMVGRGALARPSLISECVSGTEWSLEHRLQVMMDFHNRLFDYYSSTLVGGEHQVLSKIRPFWEYAESEIGRKAWKAVKKASNIAKYETALTLI